MGQKAHPIGNRLGIIRGWDSNWYGGKKYADKIVEVWGQMNDLIGKSLDERNKIEEAALRESFDNQSKVLEEQLKNKIITEEQYQYELDRIESIKLTTLRGGFFMY